MIQELVSYADWLEKDFPDLFSGIVYKGLHIEIELDDNGKIITDGFKYEIYRKGAIASKFLLELAKKENIGEMIPIYIIKNKYIDSSKKFFFSNNYYSYFFKLFKKNNDNFKLSLAFDFKKSGKDELRSSDDPKKKYYKYIQKYQRGFDKKLEDHYHSLMNNKESSIIPNNKDGVFEVEPDFDHIKNFFKISFWDLFVKKDIISNYITKKEDDSFEISKENRELLTEPVFVTFITKYYEKNIQKQKEFYLKKKLFLKEPKNHEKRLNITGKWPYLFNPILTQDNKDKFFSRHLSHYSKINLKQRFDDILKAIDLLKLAYNDKLPNPLPVFIDNDELNRKVVTLYKQSVVKKSYSQIIKSLFIDHGEDLQNYYIINYSKRKSLIINDVDFVPSFTFWMAINWNENVFKVFEIKNYQKIDHIFHLEQIINTKIFNRELRYFGDIAFSKKLPLFQKNNIYKFRKRFYDCFYKSRLDLISPKIINDIFMQTIRYEICHDKTNKTNSSENERKIKEKLKKN